MAVSMSPKQKVYQEVLHEIRKFIDRNDLKPGDKLPSERELSDTLHAGRSSIREALRAMELLGLIETRHGEGTYLSMYQPFQTVELLSSFILRENRIKHDLIRTKSLLEKEVAKVAFDHVNELDLKELDLIINDIEKDPYDRHIAFFYYLCKKTGNLLLAKVWQLMEEFSHTLNNQYYDETFYKELIQLYVQEKYQSIEILFNNAVPSAEE
ncbi:FadR/GntR family transcriptional regulator [Virgibacillus salidurans]|uniref:FadR/GntR family transcriptional regulator n=1 Tax=Virgibacillus salidurans TaxID=2831673 RepID=UPI00351CB90D